MTRRAWRTIALIATAVTISSLFQNDLAMAAVNPALSAADQYYIEYRADLGLQRDPAYILSLDIQYPDADPAFGFPMTPAEHVDLVRRSHLGPIINILDKTFTTSATYAGSWIDQQNGGILTVAFQGTINADDLDRVKSLVPSGTEFKTVSEITSRQELQAVADKASSDMVTASEPDGVVYNSVSLLPLQNIVDISVPPGTSDATIAAISERYAYKAEVIIENAPVPVSHDITTGLLYGGEWIHQTSGVKCTVTYADLLNSNSQVYAMTAGHCGSLTSKWYQGATATTRTIGTMHANTYINHTSSNCDCAAVGPLPAGFQTNKALVGATALRTLTNTLLDPYASEYLCSDGAASWDNHGVLRCGNVSSVGTTHTDGTLMLTDSMIINNMTVESGDSGAMIIDNDSFVGIVACGTTSNGSPVAGTCASQAANLSTIGVSPSYS